MTPTFCCVCGCSRLPVGGSRSRQDPAEALSGAEGIRKPDVALFEIAAKRCAVTTLAEDGWMIGDNLTADIAGGRAAGLRTIWIDRGTSTGQDHGADHVVTDVLQAMEILQTER
ncbi:HAD family hydrolase [Streptosporangium sp. NPDC087985]|uniref:HAD family hydrolase n=1 Tax=Streptosporangium sp. NPDC087985 TaxID=3366196 RepID=UPI0037F164E6